MPFVAHVINVCGLVYSGKTALFEFLRSSPDVVAFPGVETRFGRCPGGLAWIFEVFNEKGMLSEEDLLRATGLHLGTIDLAGTDSAWWIQSERGQCNRDAKAITGLFGDHYTRNAEAYLASLREFSGRNREKSPEALRELSDLTAGYFKNICAMIEGSFPGKTVIFNNLFFSWKLKTGHLYPGATAFISTRDPRDQYVDAMLSGKGIYKNVDEFISQRYWRRVDAGIPFYKEIMNSDITVSGEKSSQCVVVDFSNLIRREDTRAKICEFLGIGKDFLEFAERGEPGAFRPADSLKNVEIYSKHPSYYDDVKKIEENFDRF
jgi:hypothetical protein